MSAYYLKGIAPPEVQLVAIFKGCMPFVGMVLATLALTYIYPAIVAVLATKFVRRLEGRRAWIALVISIEVSSETLGKRVA